MKVRTILIILLVVASNFNLQIAKAEGVYSLSSSGSRELSVNEDVNWNLTWNNPEYSFGWLTMFFQEQNGRVLASSWNVGDCAAYPSCNFKDSKNINSHAIKLKISPETAPGKYKVAAYSITARCETCTIQDITYLITDKSFNTNNDYFATMRPNQSQKLDLSQLDFSVKSNLAVASTKQSVESINFSKQNVIQGESLNVEFVFRNAGYIPTLSFTLTNNLGGTTNISYQWQARQGNYPPENGLETQSTFSKTDINQTVSIKINLPKDMVKGNYLLSRFTARMFPYASANNVIFGSGDPLATVSTSGWNAHCDMWLIKTQTTSGTQTIDEFKTLSSNQLNNCNTLDLSKYQLGVYVNSSEVENANRAQQKAEEDKKQLETLRITLNSKLLDLQSKFRKISPLLSKENYSKYVPKLTQDILDTSLEVSNNLALGAVAEAINLKIDNLITRIEILNGVSIIDQKLSAKLNNSLKKITITCVSGKKEVKITGKNAKCPNGYKKK